MCRNANLLVFRFNIYLTKHIFRFNCNLTHTNTHSPRKRKPIGGDNHKTSIQYLSLCAYLSYTFNHNILNFSFAWVVWKILYLQLCCYWSFRSLFVAASRTTIRVRAYNNNFYIESWWSNFDLHEPSAFINIIIPHTYPHPYHL